jgi:hypothetical protein
VSVKKGFDQKKKIFCGGSETSVRTKKMNVPPPLIFDYGTGAGAPDGAAG